MTEILPLTFAFVAGLWLGVAFFGGLWWTVERGLTSDLAAWWFFGSTMLRTGLAVGGFYFVAAGDWKNLVACLFGFLLGRITVTRLTRTFDPTRKGAHAS